MSKKKKKPGIKYQPPIKAPIHARFPLFLRPVGPLFANNEENLRAARMIRRRVLQNTMQEADRDLKSDDKSSDIYHAYLCALAYLRVQFFAEDWIKLESAQGFFEVMAIISPNLIPLIPSIPQTEQECYEQEQQAIKMISQDPLIQSLVSYTDLDRLN